jgi:large repetitive protein
MTTTVPAYTFGGLTRPALILDDQGRIVLFGAAADFAATYGLKALYAGLPANTPYPPVSDSLSTPVDNNGGANSVTEGAAANTPVGITVSASSAIGTVTYSLVGDNSGGGFKIDAASGVVTVNDPSKIDFESAPGHAYTINVQATDGIVTSTQAFTVNVTDVAPSAPTDANVGANSVTEGAASGTAVGITAHSTDVNGGAVTYTLTADSSGGGFKVDASTGVVTVNDPTKIDFESTAPGHTYTITVQASDGTLPSSTQTFTIAVNDAPLPAPSDIDPATNTVAEGAAAGTHVGVTASAVDPNGPTTHYSLTGDTSGGGFKIDANTGVVTVNDSSKIDFEGTAPGHSYSITVKADDGLATTTQSFNIGVSDVAPPAPADNDPAANAVFEGAANGTAVGVTALSHDVNGGAVTYSLTDSAGGRFAIDLNTGVVSVANGAAIDYETAPGHAYSITAQASDGTLAGPTQTFSIGVLNVNEAPQGTDHTVTTSEGASFIFGVADFGFSDPSDSSAPNSLLAVKITTVPGAGTFTNNGVTVNAGDFVSAADIAAGHLVFAPTAHANGSPEATFTFQVQDNGGTANGGVDLDQSPNTMSINVTPVDDAPVNSVPGAQSVAEDANLVFSVANANAITISDIDGGAGNETLTLSVTSGTLALGSTLNLASFTNNAASITLTGTIANVNAAMNGLTYHGNLDFNGTDSLVVFTSDNGNTGSGGPLTDTDSVGISVTAVNDAPVNHVPGGQTGLEDTNLVFSAANGNAITISDVDANGGNETVTLTVASGTLALGSTLNLVSSTNNAASITLTGTIANVNAALDGLTYHGNANFNGSDSLTITTNDNGNTGAGGAQADTDSVAITVTPVNDAPAGTDTTIGSVGPHTFAASEFGFTDPADAAGGSGANALKAVEITTTPTSGTLVDNGVTVTAGQFVSVTDINAGLLVFTPTGNNPGTFTFQLQDDGGTANGGVDTDQSPNSFTILQDAPPVVTAGHTLNYTENQAATAIDPALTVTDSDSANLASATVQITGGYVNGEDVLGFTNQNGISGSFVAATGTLTLTGSSSVANYQTALASVTYVDNSDNPSGAPRTVTFIANDGAANSTPVTDTINVTPVNDAPVVTAGHTLNYTENQAATAFDPALAVTDVDSANLASATVQITGNYANGQDILGFTDQNGITGSFAAGSGTLTLSGSASVANYQAALDSVTYINNSDNPSGLARTVTIIANDGAASSVAKTDTINVTPVDDAPVTTAGGTLNYTENQVATAIDTTVNVSDVDSANLASATVQITGNYANGQDILGFTNQNGITGSFAAGTGTLTLIGSSSVANYKAALESVTYFNNSDNPSALDRTVSYTVNDGTLNSNTSTSTIHVTPVNDPPVVTFGAIIGFSEPPNGTPAANSTPVTIAPNLTITDVDSSNLTSASFELNNLKASDALSVSGHAGSSGDIGSIHFAISSTAGTETVSLTGTDTIAHYNSVLDLIQFNNTSENPDTTARSYTVTAVDDSGTATNTGSGNGSETVTAIDDAPVNTVPTELDSIFSRTATAITGLSVSDVDGGAGETTVLSVVHGTLNVATVGGGAAITNNGSSAVTLTGTPAQISTTLAATNGVVYASGVFTGTDVLTVTTNDNGATGTGAHPDVVSTENLGVIPKVWFIDDSASAVATSANLGTQADPFTSLASFNAATTGANDYVYLRTGTGTYSGGIVLQDGQTLIGQGDALTFPDPLHAGNTLTIENAGTAPKIAPGAGQIGIDLASGNIIHGLNVDTGTNTNAVGIDDGPAANSVGALTISNLSTSGAGKAVDIDHGGGALNVTIDSLTSTGSTTQGVNLNGAMSGTFNISAGSISGSTGVAFNVNGGSTSIDDKGTVTKTSDGQTISLVNHNTAANTVQFEGAVSSTGASDGINLSGNTNSAMSFTGGVTIDTHSSGTTGFSATGAGPAATSGGTISVTGSSNSITSGAGTALNITNTTIDSSNVTFHDISSASSGTADGIILDNTGSSGGLHVTGTGTTAASGGTISNKTGSDGSNTTGTGIYLNNTHDVQLVNMNLHDFQNYGIHGTGVDGITIDHTTVNATASGTATNGTNQGTEGSVVFSELTGTANITNDTFADGKTTDLEVRNNTSGTALTLNVSDSTFTGRDDTALQSTVQEVLLVAGNNPGDTPSITANFLRNTMTNNDARDLQAVANGAASMTINIGKNNVANSGGSFNGMPAAALDLDHNSTGNYDFNVQNATFNTGDFNGQTGAGLPINIFNGSSSGAGSTFQGRVVQNTINGGNNPGGGFDGISLTGSGPGTMTTLVDHNAISGVSAVGISYTGAQNSATNHTNLTITDNTINQPDNPNDSFAIQVSAQASSTATSVVEAKISGNNVVVGAGSQDGSPDYRVDARFANSTFEMPGYTGGSQDLTAIKNFVAANNLHNGATATSANVSASVGLAPGGQFTNTPGGVAVPLPGNAQPLEAAPGGVQASSPTAGETHLTQADLDSVVAAAIAQWAAAGASASQLAALHATTFSIADLSGNTIGDETSPAHITIDTDAAGYGWFIDSTPTDNSEFANAQNAAGTDLLTDPSNAAAGHLDLLTTVTHELGHVLGLPDLTAPGDAHDLMYINLVDGERRLPSASDVAQAPMTLSSASGGVAAAVPTPGETNLTQAELNKAVAAAIAKWAAAGLSPDKITQLQHVTYDVADIASGALGHSTPGHVTIDVDADGHGWFVDPTPSDNSEFGIALSSTTLLTDSTTAAAGHIDLVTTVMHEMGEQLGLSDQFAPSSAGTLMSAFLADGERALPSSTDLAQANPPAPVVPAWTDHLSLGADSPGGGDNFSFTPPTTTALPQLGSSPAPTQGIVASAGDSFQWAHTSPDGLVSLHDAPIPVGTPTVLFNNGFDWSAPGDNVTPPIVVGHTVTVDTTVHDAVSAVGGSVLPDGVVLAGLPGLGGYILH